MMLTYRENDFINNFYFQIFNYTDWSHCDILPLLRAYCLLQGNAISEYEACYFSPEWKDFGLKYFGENKVLFDFHEPAVNKDTQIIISYQEFYGIVYTWYTEYANQHPDKKEEIINLLEN